MESDPQLQKFLVKPTDFFGDKLRFKPFLEDIAPELYDKIHDVELECLGYGHFTPDQVIKRFKKYTKEMFSHLKNITSLKIQFNGFNMKDQKILSDLARDILNIKVSLKTLHIHTTHLEECKVQDFSDLLFLVDRLGSQNFEEMSLQFSHWKFALPEGQPQFKVLEQIFNKLLMNQGDHMGTMKNKKFRLQMSGWYHKGYQAKRFLGFALNQAQQKQMGQQKWNSEFGNGYQFDDDSLSDAVGVFHKKMQKLMNGLLQTMDNLQQFEIDFRNWNEMLKMKKLKKDLDNIKKENTFEKSIVSKRQQIAGEQQRELRMVFVM